MSVCREAAGIPQQSLEWDCSLALKGATSSPALMSQQGRTQEIRLQSLGLKSQARVHEGTKKNLAARV